MRTNEPAVVHRSSFGEDKEGTLGSFGMSSDVEVYVEANIKDEVHQSTCWKGSVVCGPKERKYKSPPPSAKGINNFMCAAEPKAGQSYYAHNLSVSHRPYTTMRRDDRRRVA